MEMEAVGPCLNCGSQLSGRWCATCGQRAVALRPSLHELLHEAFHELSHFDGKIIRTVKLLLFKPGALTNEFLDGMRVRSVTPIRLYLLCSILFFGAMSLVPTRGLHVSVSRADAQLQSAAARVNKDPEILAHAFQTAFPKAMFILMPMFGLLVWAFYWRAERMFVPHFYFAVHYHAFAFVVLALFELTSFIHGWVAVGLKVGLLLWLFIYLGVALRRVHGGNRWLTSAKILAIMPIYGSIILVAMGMIALVTLRRLG